MSAVLIQRVDEAQRKAMASGHAGVFLTITVPSRFHSRTAGKANPEFCGGTPQDAQAWLRGVWARARASMARKGLKPYGVRLTEPHSDGTPHWHVLAFLPTHPDVGVMAMAVARSVAMDAGPGRAGEVSMLQMDARKAAGLVAKYLEKDAEDRVAVWRKAWGMRTGCIFGLDGVR